MAEQPHAVVVRSLIDDTTFISRVFRSETLVDYPHDWFQQNPGKKPPITVPTTKLDKDTLSRIVYQQFTSGTLQATLVKAYLYDQLREIKEICLEDWKSFGVEIARKGAKVGIFDLLDVTEEQLTIESVSHTARPNDYVMTANILCLCRVNEATTSAAAQAVSSALSSRFTAVFRSDPIVALGQAKVSFKTWSNDQDLLKILAAVDMFFFRFSNHNMANLRLGSIIHRYKNYAALQSMFYVMKQKDMVAPHQLFEWVWSAALIADIERIMKKDLSEMDNPYSYFPYCVSLGLVKRSPYSVRVNPAIHAYCQTINTATGDIRGVNARLVMAKNMENILDNGLMTAFALGSHEIPEEAKRIASYIMGEDEENGELVQKKPPKDQDALQWYVWFEKGGKESDRYKAWVSAIKTQITNPRKGSFGEYILRHLAIKTASWGSS